MCRSTLDRLEKEASAGLPSHITASLAVRDDTIVDQIAPGSRSNPANVQRVEGIVNETTWNDFFPVRHPQYTYTNFLKAIGRFQAFCRDYPIEQELTSDEVCRTALATMFAHFQQETAGLVFLEEISPGDYEAVDCKWSDCDVNRDFAGVYVWPCQPNQQYYGM